MVGYPNFLCEEYFLLQRRVIYMFPNNLIGDDKMKQFSKKNNNNRRWT